MPQPIYLPRQPTFMEQFLGTGVMDNIMSSIMMGVQNRRADDATARGYLDKGYTEVQPVPESQQAAAPQTPEEQAAFESGPRGAYWKQHAPADVTVGTGRGVGPFHSPKRGFSKPVEPKTTFDVVEKKGQLFSVTKKGNQIIKSQHIKQKTATDPTLVKEYKFAQHQFANGVGKDPGDFMTFSRRQRKSGATRITMGEKVRTNKALQISKMQTGIRSPQFKERATKFVMSQPDADLLEPGEVEVRVREEMLKRIQNLYPGKEVVFDMKNGKLGYYIDGKLERLAE